MPINYSAHAAATRLATAEADMSKIITRLRVARGDASVYQNADLTSVGLQARREEMDMAARRAAAAPLERLRAQVATDAAMLATQAADALPKHGSDAAATAITASKWEQIRMRLDAGMSLLAVLANADILTALAVREYGPSYLEAQQYRAPSGDEVYGGDRPAPDHGPLMRSVDLRLAELTGPAAVAALAVAHDAAGIAALVAVAGTFVDEEVEGLRFETSAQRLSIMAYAAKDAERAARAGLRSEDRADAAHEQEDAT